VTQFPSVLGLTLVGLALRLSGIGRLDFWYDEIVLRNYSLTGSALYTPTEPPLMAWLLYGVMSWTRSADALVMHTAAAVIGSLTIPVAYLLAVQVSRSRTIGTVAALLTALSPMAIYYSREVRPYALLMLVSTAVYWTLLRANERNTLQAWTAYAVALCLCCLSHLITLQIAAALSAFAVAQLAIPSLSTRATNERLARFGRFAAFSVAAGVAGFVWFVPRYFTDPAIQANRGRIFGGGIYRYGVVGFLRDVVVNLGPGPFGQRFALARPDRAEVFGLIVLAAAAGGLWQLWKQGRRDAATLLGLAIGLPLAIEYLTLGEKSNWDWMRWMTHVLVPYLVVAAIGLHGVLGARLGWMVSAVGVATVAAMMAPNALHPLERPDYQQKRDIATYLRHNALALRGVLVPPVYVDMDHPADQRILETYYYLKQESLPVYLLSMGRIRRAEMVPTRGDVAMLPRESAEPLGTLGSGQYAVLTWQPAVDCGTMLRSIGGPKALARHSSPVMPGLTICDVEFGSVPN
jgi:Dolichyl-phosphate-mannose-protein mannosyltransferase